MTIRENVVNVQLPELGVHWRSAGITGNVAATLASDCVSPITSSDATIKGAPGTSLGVAVLMPTVSNMTMYSTVWCGYCRRLKAQLDRAGIEFHEVDIEHNAAAASFVAGVNGGNQTVPTVLLPDGSVLTNPTIDQIVAATAA